MAYFLKKTPLKGRTYLSIVESFYSPEKKGAAHRTYKSLASVETHRANGMDDPVAHYQLEVDALNKEARAEKERTISEVSPLMHLGYFPLKSIMEKMDIKKWVDYFKLTTAFEFDLYELLSSLVYARSVHPASKLKTFHEVLPSLYEPCNYSYDQLLDGLGFIGENYHKFIEIFTVNTSEKFGIDTSKTYFDCTNFYFEIDREDDFRRKGPSKENRKDPIVGMGLLLDKNQIPIGMELFPGNESEKPAIREVIGSLKSRNNIRGRTIHVADKGLNCAENIAFAKKDGDGYLFSKSVKQLPEKEKVWVLLPDGFSIVRDKTGRELYRHKSCIDKFPYTFPHEGKKVTIQVTEKRVLTYNPDLAAKKRYEINKMVEKAKHLTLSQAKKSDYGESGKYVSFTGGDGEKAIVSINREAIEKDLKLAGYNLLVTSETKMTDRDIYAVYNNLWRIEESFRIMKSDLDARPAFVQKENTIKGHFLICYIAVLLERLFQFKILEDRFGAQEVFKFMKGFRVTHAEPKCINVAIDSPFVRHLAGLTELPLRSYYLSKGQIQSILKCKLPLPLSPQQQKSTRH
jgi:transposase